MKITELSFFKRENLKYILINYLKSNRKIK